jgi:hypothetical protein
LELNSNNKLRNENESLMNMIVVGAKVFEIIVN